MSDTSRHKRRGWRAYLLLVFSSADFTVRHSERSIIPCGSSCELCKTAHVAIACEQRAEKASNKGMGTHCGTLREEQFVAFKDEISTPPLLQPHACRMRRVSTEVGQGTSFAYALRFVKNPWKSGLLFGSSTQAARLVLVHAVKRRSTRRGTISRPGRH